MRSIWFALKIAGLFTLLTGIVLGGTFLLFFTVAGHHLASDLAKLRALEAVHITEMLEQQIPAETDDDALKELVNQAAQTWGVPLSLAADDDQRPPAWYRALPHRRAEEKMSIRGREVKVSGPPYCETRVPLYLADRAPRSLVFMWPLHTKGLHERFVQGLLLIGGIACAGIGALSWYLTLPLRRMSASMDRIAAGDLEHRTELRGHDEVARMGKSFNAMADRISAMISGQKELLASVSHELRSPLARMKVSLELLRDSTTQAERVAALEEDIDVLDSLVEELLMVSRLDMGSAQIQPQNVDLEELVQRSFKRVAKQARECGMTLELSIASDAQTVVVDQALGLRIFGNLFENAVRYAGQGPVVVEAHRADGRVRIIVTDSGPGVPREQLARLFEPFFRLDRSRSRKTGAAGLGLMIVHRAVLAHGGTVQTSCPDGKGLSISFDLAAHLT